MPLFDYKCKNEMCGKEIEILVKYQEVNADKICTFCGEGVLKPKLAAPSFHLKGSCWAKDGYK